jgi:hypothetical protein
MTAEIGILNKSAVALAADSAVTVSNGELGGRKVYNTANKIFNLSRNQPVGIMIYNNAQICGIPWETLIKLYRESIKGKSFSTIVQYKNSFIQFLHKNLSYFTSDAQINDTRNLCYKIFDLVHKSAYNFIEDKYLDKTWEDLSRNEKNKVLYTAIMGIIHHHIDVTNSKENLKTLKAELNEIKDIYDRLIDKWIIEFEKFQEIKLLKKDRAIFKTLIYNFIFKDVFIEDWSGVVLVGFGEKQIYPQLVEVEFGAVICNNIRYRVQGEALITNEMNASITPFAQRDMIDTFVQGMDPELNRVLNSLIKETFQKYSEQIAVNLFDKAEQDIKKEQLAKISEKVIDFFLTQFQEITIEKHIGPVLNAVGSLSKEDLADLAESLINLTYLKRRISFQEEEESVGGPIDVAIITKGDGFIWLKRKHYFQLEKNFQYLAKLFKNS